MKKLLHFLALMIVFGSPLIAAEAPAQMQNAADSKGDARNASPARGPATVSASVRPISSWGTFRTAAADLLGWNVGIPANAFSQLTFVEAATKADALGLAFVEGSSTQRVSPDISEKLDDKLSPDEITAVKNKLRALNLRMPVYRVESIGADEGSRRKLFEFAKNLGVETIEAPPDPASLPELDALANEFGVNVALGNVRLEDVMKLLDGRSKRIGISTDLGAWLQKSINPSAGLLLVKDRLLVMTLRDRSTTGESGLAVPLNSGVAGVEPLLQQMYRLGLKPLFLSISATDAVDTYADLARSIEGFEKALHPVMTERVREFSRSDAGQIRGPERLSPEVREQIAAALPRQAPAKPKHPRKLLVLDINIGWVGHATIPNGNLALELMGKNTGAYEAVFSNDLDNLKYPKIKEYDAVFLNNTVGQVFVDPEVREGLVRFVREGGGLGGLHGASFTSMDWPEFMEMLGAGEGPHRIETGTLKVDDPASPLTKPFGGKEFVYTDEFYRFYANGPYSRQKLHVLLSLDAEKSDIFGGRPLYTRPDKDYALSWIHNYGRGRVFFCALGHTPTFFTTPAMTEFLLAGIQFVLGDLDADTTPSAKLPSGGGQ